MCRRRWQGDRVKASTGTDCDGDRIADVVGLGSLLESELMHHGLLDLLFVGVAMSGDGLLHFGGGVVDNRDSACSGGQQNDSSGVSHQDGGSSAGVVAVERLDDDAVWLQFGDRAFKVLVEMGQPDWK